jgi:hypothetical protein
LLTISLLFISAAISQASAQAENESERFENVDLWLYPEYDDSRLLVMLEGQIVGVEAPTTIRFLVPAAAEMYSAGSMDISGQYSGGPPNRQPSAIPEWDEISYELQTDTFRVEYYDPIIIGKTDKTISYEFRWLSPISQIHVIVQEPRQSSNFSVLPEGNLFTGSDGFILHLYDYFDLDDEQPISFDITYTKSNPLPSLSIEEENSNTALIIILAIALCALFVGGFVWFKKSKPKTRAERRRIARGAPVSGSIEKSSPRRFCSQCGQSIKESSRFCSLCGTKL